MGEAYSEYERAKKGFSAFLILLVSIIFALYEIIIVMGFNFILYNFLRNFGIILPFILVTPDIQQSMAFLLGLIFLSTFIIHPLRKSITQIPIYDYLLGLLAFLSVFYLYLIFPEIVKSGYLELTFLNLIFPLLAIFFLLEATRRALGWALPLIALAFILLGLYAEGFNLRPLINHLYYAREGIFSIPLYVMTSYVFAFIFFGSFLEKVGIGKYITDLILSMVGKRIGGPAKTAVVASALVGTVSGSSVANVLTTGTFTIPLMKKAGYPPEVAGAVEPAASTGGQLMPPVMGAAAFVMAEFLGRPYRDIMIAGAIPAILYFVSVYIFIDRVTKKLRVYPLSKEQLPSLRSMINKSYLLLPIPVITYLLLSGLEPQYAVIGSLGVALITAWFAQPSLILPIKILFAIIVFIIGVISYFLGVPIGASIYFSGVMSLFVSIIIAIIHKGSHGMFKSVIESFDASLRSSITVFLAASSAGVIQGILTLTGWATLIGYRLIDFVGGNIYLLMLSAMIISLILGMGVPTTANYIITSTVSGTALGLAIASWNNLPLPLALLTAHMFVFYFGILADVTPPVALASYAGAALAKSKFWKTAINATIFALAGYLIPYIFALDPTLLIIPIQQWNFYAYYRILYGLFNSILSMLMLSAGIVGWHGKEIGKVQRIALVILGVANLTPYEWLTPMFALIYIVLYFYNKK
ncbi:MAG: TRAP transporter permease [Thermoprotei archaeon]